MVIIKVMGGLGNQMFQFALSRKLVLQGKNVKLDLNFYANEAENNRQLALDKFNIKYDICSGKERKYWISDHSKILSKIRIILGQKDNNCVIEKPPYIFQNEILQIDNAYLIGYWQSEKYFKDIRNDLVQGFCLKEHMDNNNLSMHKDIVNTCSVAVHIRRGDYVTLDDIYGGICTELYYFKAMEIMRQKLESPIFYVFSNDIEWCKLLFRDYSDVVYVDFNDENHGYLDLNLMKSCKHHIIANSSFSWWGAWLADNCNQIVIAPKRWTNKEEMPDIWCSNWYKI